MSLKIVVLAKQVPDTRNVGKDAMTARRHCQPCGLAGYLQSRRFERIGAGSASEGAESWFYSRYIDNGPSPCS